MVSEPYVSGIKDLESLQLGKDADIEALKNDVKQLREQLQKSKKDEWQPKYNRGGPNLRGARASFGVRGAGRQAYRGGRGLHHGYERSAGLS